MRLRVEGWVADQTEVDEDEHIAQAHVAVGCLPPVFPRREDAARRQSPGTTTGSPEPPGARPASIAETEAGEGGVPDGAGAATPEPTRRSGPTVFVGAFDAVE